MKKILLLLFFILIISPKFFAQVDDDLIFLEQLFDQQNYDEMIKYKSKKIKSLSAKALFYKGLAHFNKEDDKQAYHFFDLAIKKGPANEGMYFYRGFSLFYLNKFNEALPDFRNVIGLNPKEPNTYGLVGETFLRMDMADSAIVYFTKAIQLPNCDIRAYLALADIYQQQEKFEDALSYFQIAIKRLEKHDEQYKLCLFNIGQIQQILNRYDEASKTFEDYTLLYSDDYQAVSKLIQIYYQLNVPDKSIGLKEILYKAYADRQLPSQMKEMFCIDQFNWNDKRVMAFENFDENSGNIFVCKHKFYILGTGGEIEFTIRSEKDTLACLMQGDSVYMLKMIKNDTISFYNNYLYNTEFDYNKLKLAALNILNGSFKPVVILGGYNKMNSKKRAQTNKLAMLEKDGSSFEKAIVVESVSEEYEWLGEYYPNHKFKQQSLLFEKKQPYDVLEIETVDGETINVYFDISKFFGKDF